MMSFKKVSQGFKFNRFTGPAVLGFLSIGLVFTFQNCTKGMQSAVTAASQSQIASSAPPASADGTPNYGWVGTAWGTCSTLCGGGTQSRTVSCQQSGGTVVDNSKCAGSEPASRQNCNTQACSPISSLGSVTNVIAATCGVASEIAFASAPKENMFNAAFLCSAGTASVSSGTGPFQWTCAGLNGGSSANCASPPPTRAGQCGTANNVPFEVAPANFVYNENTLCSSGTASVISGSGPFTWSCVGSNGSSASCSTRVWLTPGNKYSWSTLNPPSASTQRWASVSMSGDGSKMAALDFDHRVWISLDSGSTWREVAGKDFPGTPGNVLPVSWSADGSTLLVGDFDGNIYSSTNAGQSWNTLTGGGKATWTAIATSSNGKTIAAIFLPAGSSDGYSYQVSVSTDGGQTWNVRANGPANATQRFYWQSLAVSADGQTITVGDQFYGALSVSRDGGLNWNSVLLNFEIRALALSSDGSKMVASAGCGPFGNSIFDFGFNPDKSESACIFTSADAGSTWTLQRNVGSHAWNVQSLAMSGDGLKIVAGAFEFTSDYLYTSQDGGVTWTAEVTLGKHQWDSVAITTDGAHVAATGQEASNFYLGAFGSGSN